MAPVFQAVGASATSSGTSVSVPWPTHLADDIGIVVIEISGNDADLTPPSGWAAIPSTPVTDVATTSGSKLHVWWKRATSSSEASVLTGASVDHIIARLFTFRGCTTTGNPWDVTTVGTKTTASTTATVPAVVTTVADTLITMIVGRPNDSSAVAHFGAPVNANLTGLGEAAEAGTANGNGGGFVVSYGTKATAGNTGTSTLTKTVSTTDTYVVLAFKAGIELSNTVGTFALSGTTTGLIKSSTIIGTTGAFSLVGNNVDISKSAFLNVNAGSFNVNGSNVDFAKTSALDTVTGPFTLTGTSTDLTFNRQLVSQTGTFSIGGIDVILQYISSGFAFTLDTIVGAYDLTGTTLTLNKQVSLINQTGTFTVDGNQLGLIRTLALHSVPGTFSVAGKDSTFSLTRSFNLTTGTYSVGYVNSDISRLYQINSQVGTYQLNAFGLNYFSTRRLEVLPLNLITDFRTVGNFFWYQTTQTIQPVKYKITKRNEWILGRATHMGRRGL